MKLGSIQDFDPQSLACMCRPLCSTRQQQPTLTDWAFVRAQYRDTVLPTAGVLRQFEELFRQHTVVVMGHSVDLGSAVAAHVQGLLYSNAQYLVALCEVSPSLCIMLLM